MSRLNITNNTITLDSKVYQIRNVTSVGKYRIKPSDIFKLNFIIICGVLGWFGIALINSNPDMSAPKWFAGIVIFLAASGIIERFTKAPKYGLSIETNAGSTKLLISKDEKLIDEIIYTITQIMNNLDKAVNYSFNIADGDIINQSGNFETGMRIG